MSDDFGPADRMDLEKFFDLLHLPFRETEARDFVAGFVRVSACQFQTNLRNADLFQFVDDSKYIRGALGSDGGVGQQQVQNTTAGKPDLVVGNLQRIQAVADTTDNLRVRHLRLDADSVEVELQELAKTARPRLVGAPHRTHSVSAERFRQVLILCNHASERHRMVEPQSQVLFFGIADHKDGFLDLFPAGTRKHVEIFDRRGDQGYKPIKFVNTLNHINHGLTGQGVFRQQVPEPP